ncbi:MAG: choice-of-anchor Q domain-containing protein [Kiritimatiellae bacterium]|nr:choice-of-anchor Q domain-containing protein [Kiritimatiellia bacterium]
MNRESNARIVPDMSRKGVTARTMAALGALCLWWGAAAQAAYLTSDGDFGNQQDNVNTVAPWPKFPGAYVGVGLASAQSPFTNVFAANGMGAGWTNGAGEVFFKQTFTEVSSNATGFLYMNMDVMLPSGSGGFYLTVGDKNTAGALSMRTIGWALYATGTSNGDPIITLVPEVWYNVQLVLDLAANTYSGAVVRADTSLRIPISNRPYSERNLATLCMYGNATPAWGCVDNWVLSDTPLPATTAVDFLTRYVAQAGQTPASPYLTWASAASNIQDAVDIAGVGELVLVSNGVYNVGGAIAPSFAVTNRVMVDKAVKVRSVNGPSATIIEGASDPSDTVNGFGPGAIRCVYLGNGASLSGFTLRNGRTIKTGSDYANTAGGGIMLRANCLVSNCVITANQAYSYGGGAMLWGSAIMTHCTLTSNYGRSYGGGAQTDGGVISKCVIVGNSSDNYGGGVICGFYSGGVLSHSVVSNNASQWGPGGVQLHANTSMDNCLVVWNTGKVAHASAGGPGGVECASKAAIDNCTVANNNGKVRGGGVGFTAGSGSAMSNCIVWGNTGGTDGFTNIYVSVSATAYINNSCAFPAPDAYGSGNIGLNPRFADAAAGNFRLKMSSPCINKGANASWMTGTVDLDGTARIKNDTVDMGAYEIHYLGGTVIGIR